MELICSDYLPLFLHYQRLLSKIVVIQIKVLWQVFSFVFHPKFCDIFYDVMELHDILKFLQASVLFLLLTNSVLECLYCVNVTLYLC